MPKFLKAKLEKHFLLLTRNFAEKREVGNKSSISSLLLISQLRRLKEMKMTLIATAVGALALPLGATMKETAKSDFAVGEVRSQAWETIAPGAG